MYDDPLNQAAKHRLRLERLPESAGMPLCDLISAGLPEDPQDDARQLLEEFDLPENRRHCLNLLQEIDPERLLTDPLPDLAEAIMSLLQPRPPR